MSAARNYPYFDPSKRAPRGWFDAARRGDTAALGRFIASGVYMWARDREGINAMWHAFEAENNVATMEFLLRNGCPVGGSEGERLLEWAVLQLAAELVRLLLEQVDPGICGDGENAILYVACDGTDRESDRRAVATILLDAGASIDGGDTGYGPQEPPFFAAGRNGLLTVADLLLERGESVNCRCPDGRTALHVAGTPAMMTFLIERGADLEAKDDVEGMTPLHSSALWGKHESVRVLLDAGAEVSALDIRGKTPFANAVVHQHQRSEVMQLLFEAAASRGPPGADLDAVLGTQLLPSYSSSAAHKSPLFAVFDHVVDPARPLMPLRRSLRWLVSSPLHCKLLTDQAKAAASSSRAPALDHDGKSKPLRDDAWERRKALVCCYVLHRRARNSQGKEGAQSQPAPSS